MFTLMAGSTQWQIGMAIGVVVVAVAAVIVIAIVLLAMRIAKQAATAEGARRGAAPADGRARAASGGSTTPACASCTPPGRCGRWRSGK